MRFPHRHTALIAVSSALVLSGGVAVGTATASTPAASTSTTVATAAAETIAATDAPVRVRIGAPSQTVNVTVVTAKGVDAAAVSLKDRRGAVVATGTSPGHVAGRVGVQKASVQLTGGKLTHWGVHTWDVRAWRTSDGSCTLMDQQVSVDVRAHSMLGLAASRSGSSVTVKGSLRAYATTAGRYVSWSGQPVSVQRWDGSAWRQVGGVRTDAGGNFTSRVTVPARSQLRLVAGDTTAIWGAISATATV